MKDRNLRRHRWANRLVFAVLLAATTPITAQEPVNVQATRKEFRDAYRKEAWGRAVDLGLELERLVPNSSREQYNLACVLALDGELNSALDWLGRAAANGFCHIALLDADPDLDGVRRRVDLDEAMVSASPGTVVQLVEGVSARAFAVRHNTAALGWALSNGGSPRPAVVFAGDGTVEPFRADPSLLDAEVAVVDCSFVDTGTRVAARLGGHGHLMDWIELLPELSCDALVLAHLPPETTADSILERLPEELPGRATVVPWLAGPG